MVIKDVLGRIQTVNKFVNAFVKINEETAIIEARESEKRWMAGEPSGLLDGVPITIKDLLITKGSVTGRGSKATVNLTPETEDAPCVKNLRKNGVVFIGRTTTPEFGWKGVTDSPLTGITRNPWNPNKTPGGPAVALQSQRRLVWEHYILVQTAADLSAFLQVLQAYLVLSLPPVGLPYTRLARSVH